MTVLVSASAPRPRTWSRYRVLALVICGMLVLCLGTVFFPQPSPADAEDLMTSPGELPELSNLAWSLESQEQSGPSTGALWRGHEGRSTHTAITFYQGVLRSRNDLFAWWDYRSSWRINHERDHPEDVFDTKTTLDLKADSYDTYCVDTNATYLDGEGCGLWVYWARYGRLRVDIRIFCREKSELEEASFLQVVKAIDDRVAAMIGSP